jgi:uncharacterized protein (DUF488 family)
LRKDERVNRVAPHKLYTIGYEGASVDGLVGALKAAGVARVLDIRYSPYSKRDEFSVDALAPALAAYGIAYTHIKALGNPPAGREAARLGHAAAYREIMAGHLESPDGAAGLRQALTHAGAEPVCLLCLERSARHCHRHIVADALAARAGLDVEHLQVDRKTAHPAQAAFDF